MRIIVELVAETMNDRLESNYMILESSIVKETKSNIHIREVISMSLKCIVEYPRNYFAIITCDAGERNAEMGHSAINYGLVNDHTFT